MLKRAKGGVLFIDEAYYLYRPENERDYGQESIEILLQVMETEREDLVVILAGYKDRMETFFKSNPGMGSRVAHHLHFPDFTPEELVQIADLMMEQQQYKFDDDAREAFEEYINRRLERPRFAYGRSIRNAIDRARMRQAGRLYDDRDDLSKEDLMTIKAEDILASSLFGDEEGESPDDEKADVRRREEEERPRQRELARGAHPCPVRSSSVSSAIPRPARRRSRAGSSACSARTTSRTSRPTTTTATTAASARSTASRRCIRTATTSTSWSATSPSCAPATRSSSPSTSTRTARSARRSTRKPTQFTLIEGLLGYHTTALRDCYDVRVFLAPPEELRRAWKVQRDCSRRGYTTDQVLEELDRREPDSELYIRPQQRWADIVVSFKPGKRGDQEHLDAEIVLRKGLEHPDLSEFAEDDGTSVRVEETDTEQTLFVPGDIDPARGSEIEESVWERMHFASHLRSERLGEFTVGTELHRSESLAIVQVLVLYHLVTARATVALGGEGTRADQAEAKAPATTAPQ